MAPVEALGARMLYALAVAVYGLAAAQGVLLWRRGFRRGERLNHALLALGFVVHTAALVGWDAGADCWAWQCLPRHHCSL